ncbi:hypothetical protein AgCh_001696 [Apium graveolens]
MRSSVNNAQKFCKAIDGDKSPPTSLEPFGLHPSLRLRPPPPLPVDLTKIERVPINQEIGTMDAYLEMQKQKREMQNTQDKQAVTTNLEAHHQTFAALTEILETSFSFTISTFRLSSRLLFNDLTMTKYIIPEEGKYWVLKTLDDNWRVYKSRVKSRCFKKFDNDMDRIKSKPANIPLNLFMEDRDDDDGDADGGDESDEDGDEVDSDGGDESA